MEPGIKIYYKNLHVLKDGGGERLPLEALDAGSHLHGGLRIEINGRLVPHLGYWDADDVCFGAWIAELDGLCATFDANENTEYLYDEGEQGQPAFLFAKQDERVFLSIIASPLSDTDGDPDWQRVEFGYCDWRDACQRMRGEFVATIQYAAPVEGSRRLHSLDERRCSQ